jgi:hypothetical protein
MKLFGMAILLVLLATPAHATNFICFIDPTNKREMAEAGLSIRKCGDEVRRDRHLCRFVVEYDTSRLREPEEADLTCEIGPPGYRVGMVRSERHAVTSRLALEFTVEARYLNTTSITLQKWKWWPDRGGVWLRYGGYLFWLEGLDKLQDKPQGQQPAGADPAGGGPVQP